MADSAVDAALRVVESLSSWVRKEIHLGEEVKNDTTNILSWLRTMQASLRDQEETRVNHLGRNQVTQIRNFAYEIEDAIDDFEFREPHHVHTHRITNAAHNFAHFFPTQKALHELSSRINKITYNITHYGSLPYLLAGITSSPGEGTSYGTSYETSCSSRAEDHFAHRVFEEDDIVGFEGHLDRIREQLLSGGPGLATIFIVGAPGSGKTVLATQLYKCERLKDHFPCRAWVYASPSLKFDELLRSILTQFFPEKDGSVPINELFRKESVPINELSAGEIFSKYLQQKRFMIVLDHVERMPNWELIIKQYLKGSPGSRVLVTSRNCHVGLSFVESPDRVHELNGLSRQDALTLFCKKAFWSSNGICPPELRDLSDKIIDKCERHPSPVTAAGNLLSLKRQTPHEWKKWHDSLGANLRVMQRIRLPSHKHLPSNLRSCFLYFSVLPEGYSIQRERLIRLWIAEGFVKEERNTTLEETAENYLNELVHRYLVHVTQKEVDGRVRSCRVLNLIHEYIIAKAEEENFVGSASRRSSSLQGRIRRLSAQTDNCANVAPGETLGHVRSVFMFGRENFLDLKNFRLVKILDMQGAPLEDFPHDIVNLVLLKYLSLRETNIKTVPRSINKLALLETLDLKQTGVTRLPGSIFQLRYLCHLLVYRYDGKNYETFYSTKGVEMHCGRGALSDIQKLSLVKATTELIKKLDGMIHLRKLGLIDLESKDGRKVCESIQKMNHLSTLDLRAKLGVYLELDHIQIKPGFEFLQHLYLKGRLQKLPKWVCSLQSLIKIGLKWSRLDINPLQALQDLPNLMELHMVDSFTGHTLEFEANTFRKLKILQIEQFSELHTVAVQVNAMPALEKLTLSKCEKLNILPLGINILNRLQELLMYDMNRKFIDQLQKNREDRNLVSHVREIHSYTLGQDQRWVHQNLS